ncbi:MAG: valine--tRNA ligase, partial [Candidatus Woesearchaeota archaeon]|nr:valine--tRNA ligase [Candidatus Woesearchaeota archaeon]
MEKQKSDEKQDAYNAGVSEKKWQLFWEKEEVFKFNPKSKKPVYSIDTPPPTVSGAMHMGHAFGYSQMDFIARYHIMKGENVFYPFGFDDNGLATERFVEKKIGKRSTEMPRSEFVKICLKETSEVEKSLKQSWQALGMACDWSLSYHTIEDWCRKTSQRSFLELYKMGREYRKTAPALWCPECTTAIAQAELLDKEIESQFNEILFELEDGNKIHIATTRPELLPACVAVFVHPEDKRNAGLIGKKAKVPLFDYFVPIIGDSRADPEKGTGVVMCCTFGDQTDMEWWKAYSLPLKIAINRNGTMNETAGAYSGLSIKEARKKIIADLKGKELLFAQKPIKHMVNVHERCGTEIEFLVTEQWFIKYLDLKDKFIEAGQKIRWHPEHMRLRFENWINGLQWDWCISRQRYFGVPFPVWYCRKCGEIILADEKTLPVDTLEDKPKGECPKCGGKDFEPEKDVLDTWATSSLSPEIALKWREDDKFFDRMYPMSLRAQGHDIITFWAFNTVVKGLLHNKEVPWKDIMINGWALDQHGKKMSKSKGNVIDPLEMISKYSADCLRFWAASSKLGEDVWFNEKEFVAGQRFVNKLWNASKFTIPHLSDYECRKPKEIELIDQWLLSKLSSLVKSCTEAFDSYEFVRVRLDVENFFWHEFCDEYLEIVKDRLYNSDKYEKKSIDSAKYALYTGFLTIIKLYSPITPHITEEIYQQFFAEKEKANSITISGWP